MNHYLVDRTREHLIAAAEYAVQKQEGDLRIQILAERTGVLVQACAGGKFKTWIGDRCIWEALATDAENPLIAKIDGVLFRLDRVCQGSGIADKPESSQ